MIRSAANRLGGQLLPERMAHDRPEQDLAAHEGGGVGLRSALAITGIASAVAVLVTAGSVIGSGFVRSDIVVLVGAQLLAVATGWLLLERPGAWVGAVAIAIQVVVVTSILTVTGGGASPYVALYAPLLVLAGWFLPGREFATVLVITVVTEIWRVVAYASVLSEPEQPIIPMAAFVVVGMAAHAVALRLDISLVLRRRDQVRTAATMRAMQALAAIGQPSGSDAMVLAGQVFAARATLVSSGPGAEQEATRADAHICDDPDRWQLHLRIPVPAPGVDDLAMYLCRSEPFSSSEFRLATILAGSIGERLARG